MSGAPARRALLAAAAAGALLAGGCRPADLGSSSRPGPSGCERADGGAVRIALATLPNTLDWNKSHEASFVNYPVLHAIMRGLTALDAQHRPIPALAERWEVQLLDGPGPRQRYTFHLRKDVVWSDGVTPLTADDFVFAWRRTASVGAEVAELADLVGIDEVLAAREGEGTTAEVDRRVEEALAELGVRAEGPHTLVVTLKAPRSYFLSRLAYVYPFFPAPSAELAHRSEEERARYFNEPAGGKPMVLGAFTVESWDRVSQSIRLVSNAHDHLRTRATGVERLHLVQVDLAPVLYEQCKVDFLLVDDPSALMTSAPADLERTPLLSTYYLGINTTEVPLALRRALAHALDRERLLTGLLPSARVAWTFLPPEMPLSISADDPRAAAFPRFDLARARALISESGYRGEELTLLVRGSGTFLPELGIADALRRQLSEVGVNVRVVPSASFTNDIKTPAGVLRHDLFLKRVGADYAHPQTLFTAFLPNGNHYTDWHKLPGVAGQFADLLARGAEENDPQAAATIFARAQSLLIAEAVAVVPIYFPDRYYRRRPWIEGLGVDAFNFLTLGELGLRGGEARR